MQQLKPMQFAVYYGSISIFSSLMVYLYMNQRESFAPIFYIWKITFTFDMYLGESLKEATADKEPLEILTSWWKDVLQIFGTS